jgi:hypothetical protein
MRPYSFVIVFLIFGLNTSSLCFSMSADSIYEKNTGNISISCYHGYLFPNHRLVTYFTDEYINGFDITFCRYMPEIKPVNPPEMGGGYYFSNLGSKEIYGYVHGLYFYIARDFLKNKSPFYFQSNMNIGASYNTKHYDISENFSNRNIGSHVNIFFMYSLNLKARISKRMLISVGPTLIHTSNGNIKQPNLGLNLVNTGFNMTYSLDRKSRKAALPLPGLAEFKKNRYLFLLCGGIRQLSYRIPEYFAVGSFNTEYSRRINPYLALGLGLDFIYDPTEGRAIYATGAHVENIVPWHAGAHLSFERIWNHFSLILNSGYKIITPSKQYNNQYNRLGLRYRFDNHFVVNYSLKSHKFVADFIEFGVGYVFE